MVLGIRKGNVRLILGALVQALLQTSVFHYGLKLRASIGRLRDKDLNEFIVETLFKGGFKTIASVIYILFRSLKCRIESGVESSTINILCASWIFVMLIIT